MNEVEVAKRIEERLREQGLLPAEPPRFRYFQHGNGPMFCWTVEADDHDEHECEHCGGSGIIFFDLPEEDTCPKCEGNGKVKERGWYYSFVYRPVGKGARTNKAERWDFNEKTLRRHRKRKDAKARALKAVQG
jgi:hypothetical protein